MPKAYWVTQYSEVRDPEKLAAYAALAGPSIEEAGGRFVVIEFFSVEAAHAAHENAGYQEALAALDGGVSRDFRIVEGVE
jgi:uncharacterized protein (DUF1330 family)